MALSLRYALTSPGRAVVALEADDLRVAMQATDETDALGDLIRSHSGPAKLGPVDAWNAVIAAGTRGLS